MHDMSPDEIRAFLMNTARTGKLATVRVDGRPHIAPIWFTLDGDDILFNTWHTSVKAQNIQRDGRVSLCVDEEAPPFAYVIIEGIATIQAISLDENVRWATAISGRYMGADLAESYGKRNGVAGEHLVRLRPTKIIAKKNISD